MYPSRIGIGQPESILLYPTRTYGPPTSSVLEPAGKLHEARTVIHGIVSEQRVMCDVCGGSGQCTMCKGTSNGGQCTNCAGTGQCPQCQGTGHRKPERER